MSRNNIEMKIYSWELSIPSQQLRHQLFHSLCFFACFWSLRMILYNKSSTYNLEQCCNSETWCVCVTSYTYL